MLIRACTVDGVSHTLCHLSVADQVTPPPPRVTSLPLWSTWADTVATTPGGAIFTSIEIFTAAIQRTSVTAVVTVVTIVMGNREMQLSLNYW